MRLPSFLLLLLALGAVPFAAAAAAVAAAAVNQIDKGVYQNGAVHQNTGCTGCLALIDAHQTTYRRQKRAVTAFFRAWKQILKTTIGFQRVYNNVGGVYIQGKTFAKVGTLSDARNDFYSLGPRNVEPRPYGLSGEVGKKLVILKTTPPNIAVMDIDSPKFAPRAIVYFEAIAQAKGAVLGTGKGRFPLH